MVRYKCDFTNYIKIAARDAILFNISDYRLRKKVLAENIALAEMVKLGLAYEHTTTKLNQMGGTKSENADVRHVVK